MAASRRDDGYEAAEHLVKTHDCPSCPRSMLTARWDPKSQRYQTWCRECGRTDGFLRRESLTARWRRDPESIPVQIANKLQAKYGGVEPMSDQALALQSEQAIIQRIEQARWLAELQPRDRQSLAHLSQKYGLDPLMKELTLYEGQPYIMVTGLIRIAHRQKQFAGLEDRPMSQEERTQYGYKAPFCWMVKVYRSDWQVPAVGTGTADPGSPFRNNPIEKVRPEWMARSRALRQALKLAFPHSLPFEEVASAEEQGIDPETGEIVDGPRVVSVQAVPPVAEVIDAEMVDEPDLPFDASDAPEPTPAEEADDQRADSERADLITWLKTEYAPTNDKWAKLERWWGTHYADRPEDSDLETLRAAHELLSKPK